MGYQWNIFWADLNPVQGSEQYGIRPVLVISEEIVNQALPIVTVLALTSFREDRHIYPIEYLLNPEDSGLPEPSIVMAHQIRAISKDRLKNQCGSIKDNICKSEIKEIIKLYLDL